MKRKNYLFFLSLIFLASSPFFFGCEKVEPETPDCSLEISQAWDQANERIDSLNTVIESLENRIDELSKESSAKEDSLVGVIKRLRTPHTPKPDGGPIRTNTGNRIN